MNIVIIGGSGGIGLAMVQEALNRFSKANVHATYHSTTPTWQHPRLTWHALDATQEAQVQALSEQFSQVDWLINCVGVLHTASKGPEKNLNALDADFFLYNLTHNALPSLLLAKHFTAKLKQRRASLPRFPPRSAVLVITNSAVGTAIVPRKRRSICC